MKILVIGASGETGQKVLERLSNTHHIVSGLIRKSNQASLIEKYSATALLGDLQNSVIKNLTRGFGAIIFVAGSGGKNIQGIDLGGVEKIVDGAIENKVKRLLYIGSINSGKNPKEYINELIAYYRDNNKSVPEKLLINTKKSGYYNYVKVKTLAEKKIIESSLDYTILRAGLLTPGAGSGKIKVTPGTLHAFGEISRDNVANCFVEILENESTYRGIYTILDGDVPIKDAFC